MQLPEQKTCGTGILVINSDKLIEMPILICVFKLLTSNLCT